MRLIGLTEFKRRASLTSSADDDTLADLIASVSRRMERALGRTLTRGAYTETVRPNGQLVSVSAYPIAASPALVLTDDTLIVDPTEYVVNLNAGTVKLKWRTFLYDYFDSVTVAYTGGYAESGNGFETALVMGSSMDDLVDACVKQVKFEFQNRDLLGQQSVSMGGESVSLAPAKWLDMVKDVLWSHRRMILE